VTKKAPTAAVFFAALILQACVSTNEAPVAKASPQPVVIHPQIKIAAAPQKAYPLPSALSGLDRDQVSELLGTAPFKRKDDPAEIWQYRTDHCALDIFLYRDGQGSAFRVRHFETRVRGGQVITEKDCFGDFIKAQEKRLAG